MTTLSPREYATLLAERDGPITDAQAEAAARILATVEAVEAA